MGRGKIFAPQYKRASFCGTIPLGPAGPAALLKGRRFYVDSLRVWLGAVRGAHHHSGKMRRPPDGFHGGHRYPHHHRAGLLLGDGLSHRGPIRPGGRGGADAGVPAPLGPGHWGLLAVLFQGVAAGGREQGHPRGQEQHSADHPSGLRPPAGARQRVQGPGRPLRGGWRLPDD